MIVLSVRKWKTKTTLGADKKWEFEVGEDLSVPSPMETSCIVESRSNVSLLITWLKGVYLVYIRASGLLEF